MAYVANQWDDDNGILALEKFKNIENGLLTIDNEKEDLENKVFVIDENSTDIEYPSAKAVWRIFKSFGYFPDEEEPEEEEETDMFITPTGKSVYAMFFHFQEYILSQYSSTLINRYVCYLDYDGDYDDIYRVAFFLKLPEYNSDITYPQRTLYMTFKDYIEKEDADTLKYVPGVSINENIIEDGYTNNDINIFSLIPLSKENKTYYRTDTTFIGVNLKNSEGEYLYDFSVETTNINVKIFYTHLANEEDVLDYILN